MYRGFFQDTPVRTSTDRFMKFFEYYRLLSLNFEIFRRTARRIWIQFYNISPLNTRFNDETIKKVSSGLANFNHLKKRALIVHHIMYVRIV